jgi:hypothetical protein
VRHCGVECGHAFLGNRQEFGAVGSGHDVPRSAVEQAETELRFQFSYQNAQSGWSNVQDLGCPGETPVLRYEQESAKLSGGEIHS